MTRGEPRPVHITLIATCQVYNSVVVIQGITPGPLSPGYETRQTVESVDVLSVSRDLGGGCRAPQPAQRHITSNCVSLARVRVLNVKSVMGYGGKGRGGSTTRQKKKHV